MSNPFRYFNSSLGIIHQTVMMYISYPLCLRQFADQLFERGIDICNESVRFWWKRIGPIFAADKNTVLVVLGFLASILSAPAAIGSSGDRLVFVTSNGWHSGIVIARSDVPLASMPEAADFLNAVYLEFGWGDAENYPSPRPSFGLALRAALPGPAVMHLSGLSDHPAKVFPTASVLAVPLPDSGLRQLIAHITTSFDRAGDSRANRLRLAYTVSAGFIQRRENFTSSIHATRGRRARWRRPE